MFQSAFPFSQAVMNIFHGMFKQTSMDQAWQHRRKLFSDEIGSRNEILKLSGEIVTLCILYESIQQCSRKKKKQKKKKMPREVKNTEEQFGIHFKGFQSLLQMKIFLRRHIILKCIEFFSEYQKTVENQVYLMLEKFKFENLALKITVLKNNNEITRFYLSFTHMGNKRHFIKVRVGLASSYVDIAIIIHSTTS